MSNKNNETKDGFIEKIKEWYKGVEYEILYSKQMHESSRLFLIMLPSDKETPLKFHNVCVFKLPEYAPNDYDLSVDNKLDIRNRAGFEEKDYKEVISKVLKEFFADVERRTY